MVCVCVPAVYALSYALHLCACVLVNGFNSTVYHTAHKRARVGPSHSLLFWISFRNTIVWPTLSHTTMSSNVSLSIGFPLPSCSTECDDRERSVAQVSFPMMIMAKLAFRCMRFDVLLFVAATAVAVLCRSRQEEREEKRIKMYYKPSEMQRKIESCACETYSKHSFFLVFCSFTHRPNESAFVVDSFNTHTFARRMLRVCSFILVIVLLCVGFFFAVIVVAVCFCLGFLFGSFFLLRFSLLFVDYHVKMQQMCSKRRSQLRKCTGLMVNGQNYSAHRCRDAKKDEEKRHLRATTTTMWPWRWRWACNGQCV